MKDINKRYVIIVIIIFIAFYFITTYFLDRRNVNKDVVVEPNNNIVEDTSSELAIVTGKYNSFRILYDVVNNKFRVDQDDIIQIGDITYKKILNFSEIMNDIFTENGIVKYINNMGNYFAVDDGDYYLAGNLVSYQTYYFRGDSTNIYILNSDDTNIDAIIYEKWTSNNRNTLARVKLVKKSSEWLVDDVTLLATE